MKNEKEDLIIAAALVVVCIIFLVAISPRDPRPIQQSDHEHAEWLRSQARGYLSLANQIDPPTPTISPTPQISPLPTVTPLP
jgi:hypothetical protein